MRRWELLLLSYSVFCCQLSVTVIAPIIGLWIEKYGETFLTAGAIFSSFMATSVPLQLVGGVLSDRAGRRPFIAMGLALYSISSLLFVAERGPIDLMCLRALQGVGAGFFMPSAAAYIADATKLEERGGAMSVYNAGLGAGLALGPFVGGALARSLSIHSPFILAGVLLASACVLSALTLKRTTVGRRGLSMLAVRGCSKLLFVACLSAFLGLGVAGIMESVFSPHAILSLGVSEFEVGLALTGMFITYSLSQPLLKLFMGRAGEELTVALGFALCSGGLLAVAYTSSFTVIALSLLAVGVGLGSLVLGSMTRASKSSPSGELHGAVMGVYHSSMYVGMGLIPIAAGVLSDLYGAPSTFALTSLVLAAYTIALVLLSMRTRGKV